MRIDVYKAETFIGLIEGLPKLSSKYPEIGFDSFCTKIISEQTYTFLHR